MEISPRNRTLVGVAYSELNSVVNQAYLSIQPWSYDKKLEILTSQDWETLYANEFSGFPQTIPMPQDVRDHLDTSLDLTSINILEQIQRRLESYDDGPWYVTGEGNNIIIHNHSDGSTEEPLVFRYGNEFGEVLKVDISSKDVYGGTAMRKLKGLHKGRGSHRKGKVSHGTGDPMIDQTSVALLPKISRSDVEGVDVSKISLPETPEKKIKREANEARKAVKGKGGVDPINWQRDPHTGKVILDKDGFPKTIYTVVNSSSSSYSPWKSVLGDGYVMSQEEISKYVAAIDAETKFNQEKFTKAQTARDKILVDHYNKQVEQIGVLQSLKNPVISSAQYMQAIKQGIGEALASKKGLEEKHREYLNSLLQAGIEKISAEDVTKALAILDNYEVTMRVTSEKEVYTNTILTKNHVKEYVPTAELWGMSAGGTTAGLTKKPIDVKKTFGLPLGTSKGLTFTKELAAKINLAKKEDVASIIRQSTLAGWLDSHKSYGISKEEADQMIAKWIKDIEDIKAAGGNEFISGVYLGSNTKGVGMYGLLKGELKKEDIPITAKDLADLTSTIFEREEQLKKQLGEAMKGHVSNVARAIGTGGKAINESRKRLNDARYRQIEVQLVVIGRPYLCAGTTLTLLNIGQRYSGNWYIQTCIHQIEASGYTSSLTLIKNDKTETETLYKRAIIKEENEKKDVAASAITEIWSRNSEGKMVRTEMSVDMATTNLTIITYLNSKGEYQLANAAQLLINNGKTIYTTDSEGNLEINYSLLEEQVKQIQSEEEEIVKMAQARGFRNKQLNKLSDEMSQATKSLSSLNVKNPEAIKNAADLVKDAGDKVQSLTSKAK